MDHVRTVLPRVLRKRGLQKHADAALVLLHACEWIQGHVRAHAASLHPRHVKDAILVISADNSIAAQELQVQKDALLQVLQEQGCTNVREVRIRRS